MWLQQNQTRWIACLLVCLLSSCVRNEETVPTEDTNHANTQQEDTNIDTQSTQDNANEDIPTEEDSNTNEDLPTIPEDTGTSIEDITEDTLDTMDPGCRADQGPYCFCASSAFCACEWRPNTPTFDDGYYYCCGTFSEVYECNGAPNVQTPGVWVEVFDTGCGSSSYPNEKSIGECHTLSLEPASEKYACNLERNGYSYCPCEVEEDYCCSPGPNGDGQDGSYHVCESFDHPLYGPGLYLFRKGLYCDVADGPSPLDHICPLPVAP